MSVNYTMKLEYLDEELLVVTWNDSAGDPIDLTGLTPELKFYDSHDLEVTVENTIETDDENGEITITIPSDGVDDVLDGGAIRYRLRVVDDPYSRVLMTGRVRVNDGKP